MAESSRNDATGLAKAARRVVVVIVVALFALAGFGAVRSFGSGVLALAGSSPEHRRQSATQVESVRRQMAQQVPAGTRAVVGTVPAGSGWEQRIVEFAVMLDVRIVEDPAQATMRISVQAADSPDGSGLRVVAERIG
jgi:hypothetical protein